MAKRSKWSIQKTIVMQKVIRDSEFSEMLADLGRLIYNELSSQPDSNISSDLSSQPVCLGVAYPNRKKVVNE